MILKNTAQPLGKELARTTLCNGSALRVIQPDGNSRYCEIYTYSGWQKMDKEWAREALLTYGKKAQKFIEKHIPELLEKKND